MRRTDETYYKINYKKTKNGTACVAPFFSETNE